MDGMRTIGLLGGMSWESSVEYERLINVEVRRRLGGMHSADLLIRSYDFAEVEALQAAGAWKRAGTLLADDARRLEQAGADLIVLCTNTMHRVADAIERRIEVPLLHLADATADAVLAADVDRVALLGTRFTMEQDFYRDRLARRGLEVVVPDVGDRALIHRVIYDELVRGEINPGSRAAYLTIIDRLVEQGARGSSRDAPRSNCSSARTTSTVRTSRPPAYTRSRRSMRRSRRDPGRRRRRARGRGAARRAALS